MQEYLYLYWVQPDNLTTSHIFLFEDEKSEKQVKNDSDCVTNCLTSLITCQEKILGEVEEADG